MTSYFELFSEWVEQEKKKGLVDIKLFRTGKKPGSAEELFEELVDIQTSPNVSDPEFF